MSDYNLEDDVFLHFTTRQFSDGVPTALVGGTVEVYRNDSATQITTAETLSTPDTLAGFNVCKIAATAANGFANGDSCSAVLTAGTVGGVTVQHEVVGTFTIGKTLAAVNAALGTALTELSVAAPSATPDLRDAIMLMYMALRNQTIVQTSGTDALQIYNDAGTMIAKKLLTDDAADYTEAKMVSG